MGKFAGNAHCRRYADAMSYQPQFDWMAWDLRSLAEKDKPPPSIRNAARFMYAGAATDAVIGILSLGTLFSLWRGMADVSTQPTPSQWHLAEASGTGYIIVTTLFRMSLWLWMASKNKAGRRWARVLSTVFFVIDSLAWLLVIGRPIPGGEWQLLPPAAGSLVGVCAVALLWQRESSDFFAGRARRY